MENKLTSLEAFEAMKCFLEKYYEETNSDDIGSLLGEIQFLWSDGSTGDPAAWEDWTNCVQKVTKKAGNCS